MTTDVTTQIATLDAAGLNAYATELAQIEYQTPRLTFTRDELISISERMPEGATLQEFKTFVTLAMLQGAHPLLNEMWLMKFKKKEGGFYPATFVTAYKWFEREAREARPDLTFSLPQWYDKETGIWSEVWTEDPTKKAPYQGKIGVKTSEMTDYTWVTLRWDERFKMLFGKPQAEWKNQPIFMMTKCLWKLASEKFMPPRLSTVITEYENQEPVEREGVWENDPEKSPAQNAIEAGKAAQSRVEGEALFREGDLTGKPTPEQVDEYKALRANIDQKIIARKMKDIAGHTASSKLSSGELETLLIHLRGLEI